MRDALLKIQEEALLKIQETEILEGLEGFRIQYLGKKGELTKLLKEMGKLSAEERPFIGKLANQVKEGIEEAISNRMKILKNFQYQRLIEEEKLDVTVNKPMAKQGHRHPLYQVMEELENLFISMGFSIVEGPEIETVENNFDKLNAPKNHPTRDLSDTFYIDKNLLLRTHTSPVQIRTMMQQKPPIRIISAGRTFRFDDVDDTHSPMFHQMEGNTSDWRKRWESTPYLKSA